MVREGYKMTELGEIPEDWEVKKLEEISYGKGQYGIGASATEYVNGNPRYLRITDIGDSGQLLNVNIKGLQDDNCREYLLQKDDIVFARTGNTTGKCYLYEEKHGELVYAGFLIRFKINNKIMDSRLIKYNTQTKRYWDWVKTMSTRSGQPGINSNEYATLNIPIPPLQEQKRIAEILSSNDEIISNLDEQIEKTKEIKQGLMQELLTRGIGHTEFKQTELGDIPVEWEALSAGDIFESISKKNYQSEKVLTVTQNRGTIYRDDCGIGIKTSEESLKSFKLVEPGNFIISLRSFQGGIEYSTIKGIVSPAYTILTNKIDIYDDYYKYLLKSSKFINILDSSVIGIRDGKQISYEVFKNLKISYPPLIEQQKIASILSIIDNKIEIIEKKKQKYEEIKKGLMQDLLTGRVRTRI